MVKYVCIVNKYVSVIKLLQLVCATAFFAYFLNLSPLVESEILAYELAKRVQLHSQKIYWEHIPSPDGKRCQIFMANRKRKIVLRCPVTEEERTMMQLYCHLQ